MAPFPSKGTGPRGRVPQLPGRGGERGRPTTVIVTGTNGADVIQVVGDAGGVSVFGLAARVNITGAEAASPLLQPAEPADQLERPEPGRVVVYLPGQDQLGATQPLSVGA